MRILILAHYARPHVGGVEAVVATQTEWLRRDGHEVTVITSDIPRGFGGPGLVRVGALNVLEDRLGVPYPLFSPRLLTEVRRASRTADLIHAHGFLYQPTLAGVLVRRTLRRRPPLVLTEHVGHVDYASGVLDRVERVAIGTLGRVSVRAAAAVVVLNDRVAGEVRALDRSARVAMIPNGVDTDAYRPASPGERSRLRAALGWGDETRVLFVGRLVEKKGVGVAVQAAAHAGGAFRLTLVGPGAAPAARADVDHLGPLDPARLMEVYRAADALVLPSRGEGFPVTVQEAMASGLPVVLLDDPSYAPYLEGAGPGAATADSDAASLARAVLRVVADAGAGAAARAHAERRFAAAAAHRSLMDLYTEVLGASPRGGR